MIRNFNYSGSTSNSTIISTSSAASSNNSSISSNNPLHNIVGAGGQQTRTVSPAENKKQHLMEQLRLITAQLKRSNPAIASTIASSLGSPPSMMTPTGPVNVTQTSNMTRTTQPTNLQTNNLRPEVPRSNIGVGVINTVGTNPINAINVDGTCSSSSSINTSINSSPTGNGSQADLFPYILHEVLQDVERIGQTNIVSWNADGKSFRIHDPDAFVSFILEKYFKTKYFGGIASRLTQFRSDLKDWGFEDAVDGNRMGETFTHHCFQKGQSSLCRYMRNGRRKTEESRQETKNNTPMNTTNNVSTLPCCISFPVEREQE